MSRLLWPPRPREPAAVPAWLPHEQFTIATDDGARLAARWFPASAAQGTVVLLHPDRRYGQDWFVMTGWVDFLHDVGYHVLTFDFTGYGQSRGGQSYFHEHAIAAFLEARRRASGLPVHLIGLSLGGFVALNAARDLEGVGAVVAESPYPSFAEWYEGTWRGAVLRRWERWFPATADRIHSGRSAAQTKARRILVAASRADTVTAAELSRRVVAYGPPERTRFVEIQAADHLELFAQSEQYRQEVLRTLEQASAAPAPIAVRRRLGLAARRLRELDGPVRI